MRTKPMQLLAALACIAFAACADQLPTQPDAIMLDASLAPNVVAAASGGANWDLGGLDLTGDGIEDPVGNVLAFRAVRYANGRVEGQIEYQQSALGESFRFHGTVTCIGVYDGNRAKFGGPITRSDDETLPVGLFMWFTVVDNGQAAGSPPDRSSIFGIGDNAANEAFCASNAPPNPRFSADITSGNISVNDGGG